MRPSTRSETEGPLTRDASAPWIGANFWSRTGGPRMWMHYDPAVVRDELQVLADHGCTVTRSFCYWPDFVPRPETLDEGSRPVQRFPGRACGAGARDDPHVHRRAHVRRELGPALAAGSRPLSRCLARGPAGVVRPGDRATVPPAGGRRLAPLERDAALRWAREHRGRHGLGSHPHAGRAGRRRDAAGLGRRRSLGRGGLRRGQRLLAESPRAARRLLRPPLVPDAGRSRAPVPHARVCLRARGSLGRPVVLEEFGVSSDFAADDHAAAYYRQVLHTSLLAGARGWLAWNNTDFDDLRHQDPYRHHVFELHFGLTDTRGRRSHSSACSASSPSSSAASQPPSGSGWRARPHSWCRSTSSGCCRSPSRHTGKTSATTCSRRTSPHERPTSRSSSCASETAFPATRGSISPLARSC